MASKSPGDLALGYSFIPIHTLTRLETEHFQCPPCHMAPVCSLETHLSRWVGELLGSSLNPPGGAIWVLQASVPPASSLRPVVLWFFCVPTRWQDP